MDTELRTSTVASIRECRESLPDRLDPTQVAFGFDGFVDRVRRMVDERQDAETYDALPTLEALGDRISTSAAADSSLSIEWLSTDVRTGGHVAHLSRAYAQLGYEPVMLGTFGEPVVDPFTAEFDPEWMTSFGEPGYTDAVEFADGKLMLMEIGTTRKLDWAAITDAVAPREIADQIDGSRLLGIGYFADMPQLPTIAEGLRADVWPLLDSPPETIVVDPGDVRKLTNEELRAGMGSLAGLDELAPTTISANRFETSVLAEVLADDVSDALVDSAEAAADALDVTRFVGHGVDESVTVGPDGTYRAAVPRVTEPEITTSAGDHFNVGLSLGLINGLDDGASIILGNAVASWFVRTGDQPTYDEIREYLHEYEQIISE